MPTNGMTIDSLNTVSSLTAQDEVPVWDKEASGEPTRKITAQNMTNSVKTLGSLVNTTEMNNAIAQSTADVIRTGDVVNSLTSTATDKPLSAAQGKALNDAMTQYQTLTVNADSSKIENVTAKQIGKVVVGGFTIKANVLNSGYNNISFTISGVSWIVPPAVSVMTVSTTDDGKNFYIKVTSASGIQIRASAANTSSLECMFIGCIS